VGHPRAPGGAGASRFVTFSERVGNADMHTDSSFYPMPEEQFLLYVVRAAQCSGRASLLIDVDDIHAELLRTEAGRASFAAEAQVPFRVPSVYAASDEQVEIQLAPVFEQVGEGWRSAGATIPSSRAWRRGRIWTRRRWAPRWRC
jgi:hypothetical protein